MKVKSFKPEQTCGGFIKSILHNAFWLCVERTGCLIQKQYFRIGNNGASDSNTLFFPAGK